MKFDKKFLKTLTVLYAEDDEHARTSLVNILNKLFKKVLVAEDGQEGLELFTQNIDTIDVIISDINMPRLSGMEMLEGIRNLSEEIPFIFTTAHQENDFLLNAIKFGVFHYANKPIDIKEVIHKIQDACFAKYQEKLVSHNHKIAKDYLKIINQVAIVSQLNIDGIITEVNDSFCDISGYEMPEVIGRKHDFLKHSDTSDEVYEEMWTTINNGKKWIGKIKNQAKDDDVYFLTLSVFPKYDEFDDEIIGFMTIGFLTTEEENEKRKYKAYIRQIVLTHKKEMHACVGENKALKLELENVGIGIIQEKSDKNMTKTKDLLKQLAYYEEKMKDSDEDKLRILELSQTHYVEIVAKHTKLLAEKDQFNKKIATSNEKNEMQAQEIYKLTEQVDTQAKLILDLKDVIDFTESEIDTLKKTNAKLKK